MGFDENQMMDDFLYIHHQRFYEANITNIKKLFKISPKGTGYGCRVHLLPTLSPT